MGNDIQTTSGSAPAAADDLEKVDLDTVYQKLATSARPRT